MCLNALSAFRRQSIEDVLPLSIGPLAASSVAAEYLL
jgi:hypothetical protein